MDGQAGLHLGLSRSYEVVILDRGLPAIDGLDLLARLRSRGMSTPVLVLSALGLPRDRVDGLDAGAEDYLSKPFDVDELLARVRALRRHHHAADVLPLPGGRLTVSSRPPSSTACHRSSCPSGKAPCWKPWPDDPDGCSPGAS